MSGIANNRRSLPAKTAPDTSGMVTAYPAQVSTIASLAAIPEEQVWLATLRSQRTQNAYRRDVRHFMATVGIASLGELRAADHRAVIAWEAVMREREQLEASTIRRRLYEHQFSAVTSN